MSKQHATTPAFPVNAGGALHDGMTLRDYFAASAVHGLLACPIQLQSGPEMYARDAYAIADAMLKEREA